MSTPPTYNAAYYYNKFTLNETPQTADIYLLGNNDTITGLIIGNATYSIIQPYGKYLINIDITYGGIKLSYTYDPTVVALSTAKDPILNVSQYGILLLNSTTNKPFPITTEFPTFNFYIKSNELLIVEYYNIKLG